MKTQKMTAILLSAAIVISALMPSVGISALAAEEHLAEEVISQPVGGQADPADEQTADISYEETTDDFDEAVLITESVDEETEEDITGEDVETIEEDITEMEPETTAEEPETDEQDAAETEPDEADEEAVATESETDRQDETITGPEFETGIEDASAEEAVITEEIVEETSGIDPLAGFTSATHRDFYFAEEICYGDVKRASIDEAGGFVIYRFVPEETAAYVFCSSDEDGDPYAFIYGEDEKRLDSDGDSGEGVNFRLKYILTAGKTYYYLVQMDSDDSTGSFNVYFEKEWDFYAHREGESTRYIPLYSECTLEVNAVSTAPLKYQWFFNGPGGEIEDSNSPSYTFTVVTSGRYYCIVEDEDGNSKTCDFFIVAENDLKVSCDGDVHKIGVAPGKTVELKAIVSAIDPSGLTVEWCKWLGDHVSDPLEGADTLTFTTDPVYEDQDYVCFVTDRFGNHGQTSFSVYVENHFSVTPVQKYYDAGLAYRVNVIPGDPADLSLNVTADDMSAITYKWRDSNGVIEGANSASFVIDHVTESQIYSVTVSDQYGNTGHLSFDVIVDNNFRAFMEGGEGYNDINYVFVPLNETGELKVGVSGYDTTGVTYNWIDWDDDDEMIVIANSSSFTTPPVNGHQFHRCDVSDRYGNKVTLIFHVYVDNLTVYPEGEDEGKDTKYIYAAPGKPVELKVITSTKYEGNVFYEWTNAGVKIDGANSDSYTIDSVTKNMYYTVHISDDYGYGTILHFRIYADNQLTVHPEGTDSNSLTVYAEPGEPAVLKANVSANDDSNLTQKWYDTTSWPYQEIEGANGRSFTTEPVTENKKYEFEVSDPYGNKATIYFHVEPKMSVAVHPEGEEGSNKFVTAAIGDRVSMNMTVTAKDTGSLTYQWYYNGSAIEGANSPSYTTPPITDGMHSYYLTVTDPYGNETSAYYNIFGYKAKPQLESTDVSGIANMVYTGNAVTQKITVKHGNTTLVENTDYTVTYKNNVNIGTATVTITGKGDYSGTVEKTFRILPGKTARGDMFNLANNVKITWRAVSGAKYYKVYRSGVKDPVIVTSALVGYDNAGGLVNGQKYTYKIVASLTGKGDSSGDSPLSYSKVFYRLKTVAIRSVKNTAPGKVTVTYDKTTSGDSYVLQYSENQDMSGAKTKVVLGANKTSFVIGGLKKGKTYYISIRVRKKVNGIDYYTTFGVPKKIEITQ